MKQAYSSIHFTRTESSQKIVKSLLLVYGILHSSNKQLEVTMEEALNKAGSKGRAKNVLIHFSEYLPKAHQFFTEDGTCLRNQSLVQELIAALHYRFIQLRDSQS